jgi:branched-chain amino acid transport system substrate-binding protein
MKKQIGITLFVIIILASCILTWQKQAPEVVRIGAIVSETGVAAQFGAMSRNGIELAVEEINANGGIGGKQVVLVAENDMTDPKTAAGLYKKLTSIDHVDAIIGSNFDFTVQPVFDLAKNGATVVITPSASRIPGSLETNSMSFSMLTPFDHIVSALTEYMKGTTYSKLAVIHYTSGFGQQITTTLGAIAREQGKGDVMDETYSTFGTTDWKPYILKLKHAGVDMVFCDMLGDDLLRFTKDTKTLGYTGTIMTHNDIRNILNKEGTDTSTLENVIVLNWDVLSTDSFDKVFTSRFGTMPMNHASQAYQAVYVLKGALEQGGKADLTKTLTTQSFSTPLGTFSFTKDHDASHTPIKVQKVVGGKLVVLYSVN